MSPRGGKREGAGRPKGSRKLPPGTSIAIYLDGATQRALADVLYNGESRAAAIREAIGLLVAARKIDAVKA